MQPLAIPARASTRQDSKYYSCFARFAFLVHCTTADIDAGHTCRRLAAEAITTIVRFVVTNLDHGSAEWLYETLYCAIQTIKRLEVVEGIPQGRVQTLL